MLPPVLPCWTRRVPGTAITPVREAVLLGYVMAAAFVTNLAGPWGVSRLARGGMSR
jgi:hypothetical protein